jgi:F420-dependent oxidoreductase-like protein
MLDIAIMIEGQNGLNWPRWKALAHATEELGFAGLYRSDHFTNPAPPDLDSLDLWTSLTWLASHTSRIDFGPLVSPFSFRHPSMVARMAAAVDDLSTGRLQLGLGAGWQPREHEMFGLDLLEIPKRMKRFREGVEIVHSLLRSQQPSDFAGEYFKLDQAVLLPLPQQKGGPRIVLGGNGMQGTLSLAAKFADEWNGVGLTPKRFTKRNMRLDELLEKRGRNKKEFRRSIMMGCVFGRTESIANAASKNRGAENTEQLRQHGMIAGTGDQIVDQLKEYERIGCQRIMLQWLELDDLENLQLLAESILPHFQKEKL